MKLIKFIFFSLLRRRNFAFYSTYPMLNALIKFFVLEEVISTDKFYKCNFGDEKNVLNYLKKAMNERDNVLKNSSKGSYYKLTEEEYQFENSAYNEFFKIEGDAGKDIVKVNTKVNTFIDYIKNKYSAELSLYTDNENKFNTLYIKINNKIDKNNKNFITREQVFSDNHTSKYLPIEILERGLFTLPTEKSSIFYLGDTLDKYMQVDACHDKSVLYSFFYKKYMALFLIKLFKMIPFYERLCGENFDISGENFFAVLGNHDYGLMLQQDFRTTGENYNVVCNNTNLQKILGSLDAFARFLFLWKLLSLNKVKERCQDSMIFMF